MSAVTFTGTNRNRHSSKSLVLQTIQGQGPISRKDITRVTGLSPAAVSGITGVLVESGLVREVGEADSAGKAGRRAILLQLRPDAGYVVGVTMSVRAISCVITDLDAKVIDALQVSLPSGSGHVGIAPVTPDEMIQATTDAIERLLAASHVSRADLRGIGVGINGMVDANRGVSVHANHFGWHDVQITEPLAKHFRIPVFLENDTRALTIAEKWFGAGSDVEHFVTVAAGYGVGAGIVINRQLHRGATGGAGEFGHTVVRANGDMCHCGKRGCLESLTAIPAIQRQIQQAIVAGEVTALSTASSISPEAIVSAADAGDPFVRRLLAEAGTWLGIGLASLVNVLNPHLIIINGEVVRFGRWYLEPMEAAMRGTCFEGLENSLRIVVETPSPEMWARGAACVVLGELFSMPDHTVAESN